MKRIQTIFLCLTVALASFADIHVKGTVIDADNSEPMIGVTVLVQGTTIGTVTDFDGNFEMNVPDKATLQLSYVGYKTIELRAVANMQIIMEADAMQLQEVVSLGYSAVKKAELSSAVTTVSAEQLTDVTTSDIGNMLQGKVAGLTVSNAGGQPGDAAQIRIRGTGSINAGSAPIYVVDGVVGGAFNPNDVETISVLKDAGSTAIYGAQGAGGVIVVTTKSGKKNDKVHVDIKATAGGKQALFGNYRMMNSAELYNFHSQLFSPTVFKLQYPETLLDQDWNWQNEFFRTGVIQNYNVAVHGGSEHVGYYVSLDYFGEQGTLKTTGMQKVTGHASLKADITKWLDMNIKVDFTKSSVDYPSSWTMLGDAYFKMPWDCPYAYDETGALTNQYVFINSGKRPDNGAKWWSQETWNALHTSQYNYSRSDNFDFAGVLQLGVHFTDWLHFTTTNTFGAGHWLSSEYVDPRTYNTEHQTGYLGKSVGTSKSFGTTNILKGGYQWDKHSFNAMLGQEFSVWQSEYVNASGIGMPNGVEALNSTSPLGVGGYIMPGKGLSFFVQASYDYGKRYFITASYRTEGNSNFGSMHRWGHFPSVAASWLISNEDFMKGQDVVSFLKLRASYGITGNSDIPAYQYLSTYSLSALYQNMVAASPSRLANPDLHWETAKMAAVGIDLTFIKRIEMNIDLYQTDNTELLLYVPQPPSSGFYEVMKNSGSVRNRGIEFLLDVTPVIIKDFQWDLHFNYTKNNNEVLSLPAEMGGESNIYGFSGGTGLYAIEGKELGIFKAYTSQKDENGNVIVNPSTGLPITTDDVVEIGSMQHKYQMGFGTTLKYKGVSLAVNFDYRKGGLMFSRTKDIAYFTGNAIQTAYNGRNPWVIPGSVYASTDNAGNTVYLPNTTPLTPTDIYNYWDKGANELDAAFLVDKTYLKLRSVVLSWELPRKWFDNFFITGASISFFGNNLFLWTPKSNTFIDPESTSFGNDLQGNFGEYSANPSSRKFGFNVNVKF